MMVRAALAIARVVASEEPRQAAQKGRLSIQAQRDRALLI